MANSEGISGQMLREKEQLLLPICCCTHHVRSWIPVPLFQMASATAADLAGPAFTNPPYSSICPTQATLSQLVATVWNWELNPSRSLETSLQGPWPGFKYLANSLIGHFCVTQTLFWSQI